MRKTNKKYQLKLSIIITEKKTNEKYQLEFSLMKTIKN